MFKLIKASIFKLFRDITFRITLIIGLSLAVMMPLLYAFLDFMVESESAIFARGESLFISGFSCTSNFGLTIPINLVVFTVGEFTYGTIRNKIIAGHKKSEIYIALLITGFIFTILLMTVYIAVSTLIATMIGGFSLDALGGARFFIFFLIIGILSYLFIVVFSVFIATSIRAIGGSLPLIIISLVMLGLIPTFVMISDLAVGQEFTGANPIMWIDPLYMINLYASTSQIADFGDLSNEMIAAGIIVPLIWTAVFTFLGMLQFSKRDVK